MQTLYRQRGMSFFGWLFVLLIIGFLIHLSFLLLPAYKTHFLYKEVLGNIELSGTTTGMDTYEVNALVNRNFKINVLPELDNKALHIQSTDRKHQIIVDYAVHKPLIGNISLTIHFHEEFQFSR